jgi:hypothetical protein
MTLKVKTSDDTTVTFHDETLPSHANIQDNVNITKLWMQATCGAFLFVQ